MGRKKSRSKRKLAAKIFDMDYALSFGKGYDLKVTLKKNFKGTSLFATKPIKKGNVIAYYKFKLNKQQGYTGKKKDMYNISVYTRKGHFNPRYIGDVFEGSLEKPKYNIPFWAYFSNEPSKDQVENCALDVNTKGNFRKRDTVKAGETMVYKLVATKNINPGDEICWCYGDNYIRDYPTSCE